MSRMASNFLNCESPLAKKLGGFFQRQRSNIVQQPRQNIVQRLRRVRVAVCSPDLHNKMSATTCPTTSDQLPPADHQGTYCQSVHYGTLSKRQRSSQPISCSDRYTSGSAFQLGRIGLPLMRAPKRLLGDMVAVADDKYLYVIAVFLTSFKRFLLVHCSRPFSR